MHLGDKVLEHFLGDLEVGDHPVFQRPYGGDIARGTAQHALGFGAHSLDRFLAVVHPNRNHRGLIQHDPLIAHINQRVGGTKIYGEIVGEHSAQFL